VPGPLLHVQSEVIARIPFTSEVILCKNGKSSNAAQVMEKCKSAKVQKLCKTEVKVDIDQSPFWTHLHDYIGNVAVVV
jgi:hypothetical protein